MSIGIDSAERFVNPRPGLARAIGIANITIATIVLAGVSIGAVWLLMIEQSAFEESVAPPRPPLLVTPSAATPMIRVDQVAFGMDEPAFLKFVAIDAITAFLLNVVMFVSGLGLLNLRPWGARWWTWGAWSKIIRLVLLWGGFVILVAPSLSDRMARFVLATTSFPPGKGPQLAQLTTMYGVLNLILAAVAIVFGCLYPVASLWALGRPGIRRALSDASTAEVDLT